MWPCLVQALRHLHGTAGREAEFAIGFLLQRAGGERRIGLGGERLFLKVRHTKLGPAEPLVELLGGVGIEQKQRAVFELAGSGVKVFPRGNLAAIDRDEIGLELLAGLVGKRGHEIPIRGGNERHPLPFALDDQPYGHALDSAGGQFRPHFSP